MFHSTRNQIVIFLGLFCITVFIGYYLFWRSNIDKVNFLIDDMKSGKEVLLAKTIEFKSKNLISFTTDYSFWDDMVSFVNGEKPDAKWAYENLDVSIPNYEADYAWLYTADLDHFYTSCREGVAPIAKLPFDKETMLKIVHNGKKQHFFIALDTTIIEISEASIHPTSDPNRVTPPQGYLFAGRSWSISYLKDIGLFTGGEIHVIIPPNDSTSLTVATRKYQIISKKELTGWDHRPVALIESVFDYKIAEAINYKTQQRTIFGAIMILLIMGIFISFFGLKVYKPLGTLVKSLKTGDPQILDKLFLKKDEFGRLSILINDFFKQKNKLLQEIDERIQVENLLIKLSQAVEQSPSIIVITGTDDRIEYVNPKFTSVSGYKLDEVIGKKPVFLVTKKSKEDYKQMWRAAHQGQIWNGEFCNRKKNGEIYYESVIVSPIFDESGIITNFLAVNEDITHKKQDEIVRNIIFEIAKAGSISKNLEELIEQISIHLSQIIDVTNFYIALYDEQSDSFFLPLFKDQKDNISHFSAKKTLTAYVLKTKKSFLGKPNDIEKLKKAGLVESIGEPAKVWLGVPLMVDDKAMGVFSVQSYDDENAFDEKDKTMLEFVSHEISHTIQRIKAEADIVAALERAEQSDKLKSAFLANMSHEIRTPLNSILGFTKLMADPEIDPVKKHRFTSIIKHNGNQLLSIINGLLDFSLIETGQIKMLKKKFVLEKLIIDIRNEYIGSANEKGIEIITDPKITSNETVIESDLSRLRQTLSNILDNAVKFTNNGQISIDLTYNDNDIRIMIKDTGVGIPEEFKQYVFDRFRQADKSNIRKFGGNGLGLAISKHIVELMGGRIWFESEEGKGSIFNIEIPYSMSTPEKNIYVKSWGN